MSEPQIADAASPAPARLLLVDDEASILSSLKRLFRPHGYIFFTATSGQAGLEVLAQEPIDLVISDMRMPEMDGAQFLEQVASRWPETKRILLTGYADIAATIAAINQGKIWRYVAKPWNADEIILTVREALEHRRLVLENARLLRLTQAQNEALQELNNDLELKVKVRTADLTKAMQALKEAHSQLRQGFVDTVRLFSSLVELRSVKLAGHSRRVADTTRRLAEALKLSEADQQDVLLAALLHDIGKIGLPDHLLDTPFNALDLTGRSEVMRHPSKGQQLLTSVKQLANAARIIRHHHECMDGSGYPDHLSGPAIPLGARILAAANDYDALQMGALTLHKHTPSEARKFLVKERSNRYDPDIVDALVAIITEDKSLAVRTARFQTAQLQPGMTLASDLMHPEGYLLLQRGLVLDADAIARLVALEQTQALTLAVSILHERPAAVMKPPAPEAAPQHLDEVALSAGRLRQQMVLSRDLYLKEGHLMLPRGAQLDEAAILQLREFEKANDEKLRIFVRIGDR
ncbi:MAG: response regulator [Betaproteobacteria bacterium]|nr:response regulator [Betaproteobacteria bacterium]